MERVLRRTLHPALGVLAALTLSCATPPAVQREIAAPARQFRVQQLRFPSGMQLLVEDSDEEHTVASVLVFGAGAADDPPGKEGLAHLVEHLTFRAHGPNRASVRQRIVDDGIGHFNAATTMDTTDYQLLARPERVGAMVRLEASRLRMPLEGVDEAVFTVERQVVQNELLQRYGDDRVVQAENALFQQLYPPGDRYAHAIIGTSDSLARLTLEDARAFVRDHYRPGQVTWVIAGKVDRTALLESLRQEIPPEVTDSPPSPSAPTAPTDSAAPPPPAAMPVVRGPWRHRELLIGWTLPPATGPLKSIIETIPPLVATLVRVDGVEHRSARLRRLDRSSVVMVSLELTPQAKPEVVRRRFLEALPGSWPNVWYQPGTRAYAAFAALRTELLEERVRAMEPLIARTRLRALEAHRTQSPQTLAVLGDSVLAMHYPEILRMAQKYVTPERARTVLLDPTGAPAAEADADEDSPHLPIPAPSPHPAEDIAALARGPGLEVRSFRASNGLQVLVAPMGKRDVVSLVLAVPEGTATTARPGMAEVARLAEYRTKLGRALAIDRRWDQDLGLVRMQAAPSQLPELLQRLGEEANVRIGGLDDPASLKFSGEPEGQRFDRRFWRALYGASRWGVRATVAEIKATSVGEVNDWLEQAFDPGRAVLVVAGDVQGDVQAEVERQLAPFWRPRKPAPATSGTVPAPWGRLRLVSDVREDRAQVRVRFGCLLSATTLADRLGADLLANELEMRWSERLRESGGQTYGVQTTVRHHRDGTGDLMLEASVQASALPAVAAEIERAWTELPGSVGDPAVLRRLQWEYAREYSVRHATGLAVAMPLARERLRGEPATVLDEVAAALLSLTAERMSSSARACQATSLVGLQGRSGLVHAPGLFTNAERVDPGL